MPFVSFGFLVLSRRPICIDGNLINGSASNTVSKVELLSHTDGVFSPGSLNPICIRPQEIAGEPGGLVSSSATFYEVCGTLHGKPFDDYETSINKLERSRKLLFGHTLILSPG